MKSTLHALALVALAVAANSMDSGSFDSSGSSKPSKAGSCTTVTFTREISDSLKPTYCSMQSCAFVASMSTAHCVEKDGGSSSSTTSSTCEAGKMKTSDGHCVACPVGKVKPSSGDNECTDCDKGTFIDVTGKLQCFTCRPGKYQDQVGSSTCKDCPAKTYQSDSGALVCKSCDSATSVGSTTCSGGTQAPAQCTSTDGSNANSASCTCGTTVCTSTTGLFCNSEHNRCFATSSGTSSTSHSDDDSHDGSSSDSKSMPSKAGNCTTVTLLSGMTQDQKTEYCSMQSCTFVATISTARCVEKEGSSSATTSSTCEAGKMKTSNGCVLCPKGKVKPDVQSTMCMNCAKGQYTDLNGQVACKACGTAKYSSEEGASQCLDCPSGWAAPQAGSIACTKDSSSSTSLNTSSSNSSSACAGGKTPSSNGLCVDCPQGKMKPSSGDSACVNCKRGYFMSKAGQTECHTCPKDKYTTGEGQATCKNCPSGWTSHSHGAVECTLLANGGDSSSASNSSSASSSVSNSSSDSSASNSSSAISDSSSTTTTSTTSTTSTTNTTMKCNKGMEYFPSFKMCIDCPSGTHQPDDNVGESACKTCTANTYAAAPKSTECVACASGEVSPPGAPFCMSENALKQMSEKSYKIEFFESDDCSGSAFATDYQSKCSLSSVSDYQSGDVVLSSVSSQCTTSDSKTTYEFKTTAGAKTCEGTPTSRVNVAAGEIGTAKDTVKFGQCQSARPSSGPLLNVSSVSERFFPKFQQQNDQSHNGDHSSSSLNQNVSLSTTTSGAAPACSGDKTCQDKCTAAGNLNIPCTSAYCNAGSCDFKTGSSGSSTSSDSESSGGSSFSGQSSFSGSDSSEESSFVDCSAITDCSVTNPCKKDNEQSCEPMESISKGCRAATKMCSSYPTQSSTQTGSTQTGSVVGGNSDSSPSCDSDETCVQLCKSNQGTNCESTMSCSSNTNTCQTSGSGRRLEEEQGWWTTNKQAKSFRVVCDSAASSGSGDGGDDNSGSSNGDDNSGSSNGDDNSGSSSGEGNSGSSSGEGNSGSSSGEEGSFVPPVETWYTKLETCMSSAEDSTKYNACKTKARENADKQLAVDKKSCNDVAGEDQVKIAACNKDETDAKVYTAQDIGDAFEELKSVMSYKLAEEKLSECRMSIDSGYEACKTNAESELQEKFGGGFDIGESAAKGKVEKAADDYSICLSKTKELSGKERETADAACFNVAQDAGFSTTAQAEKMEKKEKDEAKKIAERFGNMFKQSQGTTIDMNKDSSEMSNDEKAAKEKFMDSRKKVMESMQDVFTGDGENKELENGVTFTKLMEKRGKEEVKEMFTNSGGALTTESIKQKMEEVTGKKWSDVAAKQVIVDAQAESAQLTLADNKDKTEKEIFDATKASLETKFGTKTKSQIKRVIAAGRKNAVTSAMKAAVEASNKGQTVTTNKVRIDMAKKALAETGRKDVSDQEAAKVVEKAIGDNMMESMKACMENAADVAAKKKCFSVVQKGAKKDMGLDVSQKSELVRKIKASATSKIKDMVRDCRASFRGESEKSKLQQCMADVRKEGANMRGETGGMTTTDIEKAAMEGTASESVDSMKACLRENSDKSDPRSVCIGGDIKEVIADNTGKLLKDIKSEDCQEFVNSGSSSHTLEETRACRVAAGEDESEKKKCMSHETMSTYHSDTTGEESPSKTTTSINERRLQVKAYQQAAMATAEADESNLDSDAMTLDMYKRDTGGDFNNDELALNKIAMQKEAAAMQAMMAAKACSASADVQHQNQGTCEDGIVKDYRDASGMSSDTDGGGRRRLNTQTEKIGIKKAGAKALIESRIQACLDTNKKEEMLKDCVYSSTKLKKEYELLRADETKANDIRQVASFMSAQREVDCRNGNGGKTACKEEGKRLLEHLKYSAPTNDDKKGVRPQETYEGARARRLFQKFNEQTECDESKKKACDLSIASEGEKLGYEKSQLKMARLQSLKSWAAQTWADSKETAAKDEDSVELAKTLYLKHSTAEDFASVKDSIVKLGRSLYEGKPTEVRISDTEVDTVVTSPTCDATSIETNRLSIKRAASNAKTIVMSQPTKLPSTKACQIRYKSQVANGAAARTASDISQAMSRRRARALYDFSGDINSDRRRLAGSDVSSSPSQEEVPYGEESSQEFVEPTTTSNADDGTTKKKDDAATNDVVSDDDFNEGKLSAAANLNLQVIFMIVAWVAAVQLC